MNIYQIALLLVMLALMHVILCFIDDRHWAWVPIMIITVSSDLLMASTLFFALFHYLGTL
jgi:hypothetical protein